MATIVVSDTSPLRALHHLQLLSLCQKLYGIVIVPEAIQFELRRSTSTCPAFEIMDFQGFDVRKPSIPSISVGVPADLDPGKIDAMTLAIELHADLILMDERKGTEAARRLGLIAIGVLGLLLNAKRAGMIEKSCPSWIDLSQSSDSLFRPSFMSG